MNSYQTLSEKFLLDLYLSKTPEQTQPILQILAFQISEHHPKEIIIRLSDGLNFFEATLIGPYDVVNNKIIVSPFTSYHSTSMEFKRYDVVKIVDFFSKMDDTKICRLKMMIRKIIEVRSCDKKIKHPQQLSSYVQFNKLLSENSLQMQAQIERIERYQGQIKDKAQRMNKPDPQIKICEDDFNIKQNQLKAQKKISMINKEMQILGIRKDRNPQQPLTVRQIMDGYDGFFIGRLLRMKQTQKEGKQGPIPMLTLGFLDSASEIMRINLLGKMAMRQQKQLKKGRCYYLKGLEVIQTKGNSYIKLRQKDYKLHIILNEQSISNKFSQQYYYWEHEHDYIENQNVDVIGIVEDIEEKTFYGTKSIGDTKQAKEVIRVVIRNKFKTVKVSFWSDQMKNLMKYNLKKGEVIFIEDVKKKKFVFLDYSTQSNLIKIQPESDIHKKLSHLLAQNRQIEKPINISSIYKIQQVDKYNSKTYTINAFLARIHQQKMIFKSCDLCKKNINILSQVCYECKGSVMSFKYNTFIQFSDYSACILLSVFDNVAEKLFGIPAIRMKQIKENGDQFDKLIDKLTYQPFMIGIEIKNQRFILRSIQPIKENSLADWCTEQVTSIKKLLSSGKERIQN